MFPQIVLKMNSSSRFLNALEMKTWHLITKYPQLPSPQPLVLCPAVGEDVGELERDQLGAQPPDGRHVEELEVLEAEE